MEVCCGFFGFDAGDAIEEAEENPFAAPPVPHKHKQKHPLGVARHKPARHKKKKHRVIPKHHHAARASTVAKGNGTQRPLRAPQPTGVAWVNSDDAHHGPPGRRTLWSGWIGSNRQICCDHLRRTGLLSSCSLVSTGTLAMSLILVHLHLYELRHWMITKRNQNGWNAACYVNEVPAGYLIRRAERGDGDGRHRGGGPSLQRVLLDLASVALG